MQERVIGSVRASVGAPARLTAERNELRMADATIIAWTDHTFNPWMGCQKVSAGCAHCYAERLTRDRMGLTLWGEHGRRQVTSDANWAKPRRWSREAERDGVRSRVFCASLCDVFEDHPVAERTRPRLWSLIEETPHLDWQLLTKRPERIAECLPAYWGGGWPNVWLGTSIEDARVAHRAAELAKVPAVVRFVSYEPALGPIHDAVDWSGIDWVIVGGESGPGYRPFDLAWARALRDVARERDLAFFFKQSAAYRTEVGIELDGEIVRAYPEPRTPIAK